MRRLQTPIGEKATALIILRLIAHVEDDAIDLDANLGFGAIEIDDDFFVKCMLSADITPPGA